MRVSFTEPADGLTLTDEETILGIVARAREGDESSFTALYQWYYTPIYRHLVRLVSNHEEASDLAMETFSKVWRALPSMQDTRCFRRWLYQIATNAALDHLRRKKSRPPLWENAGEDMLDKPAASFEDRVEEGELVGLALKQVQAKPRACLLLQLEGFSQAETASLLGLQTKSVGTYVSMAREQFRRAYYRLNSA